MAGPELCVGAVVVEGNNLLLIRRGRGVGVGHWSIPGGRVESGETVGEAVVRELREETGLDGFCGALLGWVERIDADHHFVILDFVVDVLDARPLVAGDDASEAAWFPLHEVAELDLVDGLAEFLHEHGVLDTIT